MLPNSLPHWCIIDIRSSPNKQVSSPSNTYALQWNPAHCGIPGYEQADQLAKCTRRATINQHPLPGKDHHHQNSAETQTREVVLAWLLSGHNRLNAHIHRKLKIVPSPTCPCGEEDQTTENVLQICDRHQPERMAQWPPATPLHQKLYGGLEDLNKTTNFITAAGLVV